MAEFSPLAKYNELADQFGITGKKRQATDLMLQFAQEQAGQMKSIANRLLFDLMTSYMHLDGAQDVATKNAYKGKINQYENDLAQTNASLDSVLAFIAELEPALIAQTEK